VSVASWNVAPIAWAKRSGVRNQTRFSATSMNPTRLYSSCPATPSSRTAKSPIARARIERGDVDEAVARAARRGLRRRGADERRAFEQRLPSEVDRHVRGGEHLARRAIAVAEELGRDVHREVIGVGRGGRGGVVVEAVVRRERGAAGDDAEERGVRGAAAEDDQVDRVAGGERRRARS
jgi:hypothetical protein